MIPKKAYIEKDVGVDVLNWSFSSEAYLNIITPPYSSAKILFSMIKSYLEKRKRILYVTDENFNEIEIIDLLKTISFKRYTYVRSDSSYLDSLIVICSFQRMLEIKGKFELVVIDDSKSYPKYDSAKIMDLISFNFFKEAKYISLSIESIFEGFKEIIIPVRENKLPLVEPRFLTTRIDLSKEIPYAAYDYIKWSAKVGQNIIIYVTKEDLVIGMFNYLSEFKEQFKLHIMFDLNGKADVKAVHNFLKNKGAILISNDFTKTYGTIKENNIIILSSDSPVFNYKSLVYFCGKVGKGEGLKRSEVIFLANDATEDMEKAKAITRGFNKEAWERNLLEY